MLRLYAITLVALPLFLPLAIADEADNQAKSIEAAINDDGELTTISTKSLSSTNSPEKAECIETEAWPTGTWSGSYRMAGDELTVRYDVRSNGNMDMQLELSPKPENRYSVTNVQWHPLEIEFNKDDTTLCKLNRKDRLKDFTGSCTGPDGDIVVPYISMRPPSVLVQCPE